MKTKKHYLIQEPTSMGLQFLVKIAQIVML